MEANSTERSRTCLGLKTLSISGFREMEQAWGIATRTFYTLHIYLSFTYITPDAFWKIQTVGQWAQGIRSQEARR